MNLRRRWHCCFSSHYDGFMAPLEKASLSGRRARLLEGLSGTVLEIGAGTGANLIHYSGVGRLLLGEPDAAMRQVLRARFTPPSSDRWLLAFPGESLPLPDGAFDHVVSTLVLCSVSDPERVCSEIRRVLKPGGSLSFIEHVRAAGGRGRLQDVIQPIWSAVGCGCRPNRPTLAHLARSGLQVQSLEEFDPFLTFPPLTRSFARLAIPFVEGRAVSSAKGEG